MQGQVLKAERDEIGKNAGSYTDGAAAFLTKVPNLTDDNTKEMN